MKYNLTTLKIYFKQGRKFKFLCQIGLKYSKIVFKYWKYILNTLKSASKYIWFGKGIVIQTKAALVTVLQLSFRKTILNLHLRVQTTSKQLTISIFAPRIFRPTCLFTDKEDSGRGITTGTDKEIQSRNEARIPQNTKRSTKMSSWSTRVRDDWLKNRTPYHDSDTFVDP